MSVRTLAEKLSRGIVLRRRLPSRYGGTLLYVAPECGGLKYWRKDLASLDPGVFALVDEFISPGVSVWDVGANVGLFTFPAAHRAGREGYVLAIEPDVDNSALLLRSRQSLDPERSARVEVFAAAISAPSARVGRLVISGRSRAANALAGFGTTQLGACREERTVPLFALDELRGCFPKPDVIKIDVEGAEAQVLSGARDLLGEDRPIVLVEVSSHSTQAVSDLLHAYRYHIFDGDDRQLSRREMELAPWNAIALPE